MSNDEHDQSDAEKRPDRPLHERDPDPAVSAGFLPVTGPPSELLGELPARLLGEPSLDESSDDLDPDASADLEREMLPPDPISMEVTPVAVPETGERLGRGLDAINASVDTGPNQVLDDLLADTRAPLVRKFPEQMRMILRAWVEIYKEATGEDAIHASPRRGAYTVVAVAADIRRVFPRIGSGTYVHLSDILTGTRVSLSEEEETLDARFEALITRARRENQTGEQAPVSELLSRSSALRGDTNPGATVSKPDLWAGEPDIEDHPDAVPPPPPRYKPPTAVTDPGRRMPLPPPRRVRMPIVHTTCDNCHEPVSGNRGQLVSCLKCGGRVPMFEREELERRSSQLARDSTWLDDDVQTDPGRKAPRAPVNPPGPPVEPESSAFVHPIEELGHPLVRESANAAPGDDRMITCPNCGRVYTLDSRTDPTEGRYRCSACEHAWNGVSSTSQRFMEDIQRTQIWRGLPSGVPAATPPADNTLDDDSERFMASPPGSINTLPVNDPRRDVPSVRASFGEMPASPPQSSAEAVPPSLLETRKRLPNWIGHGLIAAILLIALVIVAGPPLYGFGQQVWAFGKMAFVSDGDKPRIEVPIPSGSVGEVKDSRHSGKTTKARKGVERRMREQPQSKIQARETAHAQAASDLKRAEANLCAAAPRLAWMCESHSGGH